jgi:hypothetical protein
LYAIHSGTDMPVETFESFQVEMLSQGFDHVVIKEWAPHFANELHDHDWHTTALVAQGDFWLTRHGKTIHHTKGDLFTVSKGEIHSEKYGPEGATFWAARKNTADSI